MIKSFTLALSLALAAGSVAEAQSTLRSQAPNGMVAVGTAGDFDVLSRPGAGESDYFCAAANFARSRAGAVPANQVIVTRSLGPSKYVANRNAVGFTVGASGEGSGASGNFLNAGRGIGSSVSVGTGLNKCRSAQPERRGR